MGEATRKKRLEIVPPSELKRGQRSNVLSVGDGTPVSKLLFADEDVPENMLVLSPDDHKKNVDEIVDRLRNTTFNDYHKECAAIFKEFSEERELPQPLIFFYLQGAQKSIMSIFI